MILSPPSLVNSLKASNNMSIVDRLGPKPSVDRLVWVQEIYSKLSQENQPRLIGHCPSKNTSTGRDLEETSVRLGEPEVF